MKAIFIAMIVYTFAQILLFFVWITFFKYNSNRLADKSPVWHIDGAASIKCILFLYSTKVDLKISGGGL